MGTVNLECFTGAVHPETEIKHILSAISKLSTLFWKKKKSLKQIVWETQIWH